MVIPSPGGALPLSGWVYMLSMKTPDFEMTKNQRPPISCQPGHKDPLFWQSQDLRPAIFSKARIYDPLNF